MQLTDGEKRVLAGERGRGIRRAMEVLVKLGEAHDAEKLTETAYAHISYNPKSGS